VGSSVFSRLAACAVRTEVAEHVDRAEAEPRSLCKPRIVNGRFVVGALVGDGIRELGGRAGLRQSQIFGWQGDPLRRSPLSLCCRVQPALTTRI